MDSKNKHQISTLSFLLDCAVKKVFPETQRIKTTLTEHGCISEYHFPFLVQDELLMWIERELKALVKAHFRLEEVEMVPISATGLFTHQKEPYLAALCQDKPHMIALVRYKDCTGIMPKKGLCLEGPLDLAVKLVLVGQEAGYVSLQVFGDEDRKKLKAISVVPKNFLTGELWVERLALVLDKEFYTWSALGNAVLEKLEKLVQNELGKEGFQYLRTLPFCEDFQEWELHQSLFLQQDIVKIGEISKGVREEDLERFSLRNPLHYSQDHFFIYGEFAIVQQEMISSLQRIEQILKILSFDPKWIVALPPNYTRKQKALLVETCEKAGVAFDFDEEVDSARLEARVRNYFGAFETLGYIQVPQEIKKVNYKKDTSCRLFLLKGSVLGVIEKALALLLEQNQGKLGPLLL